MGGLKQAMDELDKYLGENFVRGSVWVRASEAHPPARGQYMVIIRRRGKYSMTMYLWNGGYWVTAGGSPAKAVEAWLKEAGR